MRGTFFGIELARRALFAQQRAMDVASHNIANANNPAYARQRAAMVATIPYAAPGLSPDGRAGQVGTGVEVAAIERIRDAFLDARLRGVHHEASRWRVRQEGLEQLERLFNEPSENGIRVALDRFWESLQDLSVTPESMAEREVVVQRGRVLADAVRNVFDQLEQLRGDLDRGIALKVEELNGLSHRVAQLNAQIRQVVASGQRPNDLLDQRDALLEQMAGLTQLTVTLRDDEMVAVSIDGLMLVDGRQVHELTLSGDAPERQVVWDGRADMPVPIRSGEIGSQLALRGTLGPPPAGVVPELMADLDRMARELVAAFNAQHASGYDLGGQQGGPFFDVTGGSADRDGDGYVADDMVVASKMLEDPGKIAAAKTAPPPGEDVPGDGENARLLAGLKSVPLDGLGGASVSDYFASLTGRLGVVTQEAQTMTANQELLRDHLDGLRQALSGVSLDEEMADLVRFEHAYGAAARAMTSMDEVLDTLINRTGVVGR